MATTTKRSERTSEKVTKRVAERVVEIASDRGMRTVPEFLQGRLIRTEEEYEIAAMEVDRLLDLGAAVGTSEYDRLEYLTVLIERYDEEHVKVDESLVTPQSIAEFMLEQKGMTRADLVPLLGSASRVSEFLSGKRRLSLRQIEALRDNLGISPSLLIGSSLSTSPEESI